MRPLISLVLLTLPWGCGGGGSSSPTPAPTPAPTTCPIPVAKASPSFSTDLVPAIQSSCGAAATSCHGGQSPTGHVLYSGTPSELHARLFNVVPANAPTGQGWVLVKPGDPARSWLLEKVTKDQPGGSGYGTRMPQATPNLCQATVDTLTTWINAGAPSN